MVLQEATDSYAGQINRRRVPKTGYFSSTENAGEVKGKGVMWGVQK